MAKQFNITKSDGSCMVCEKVFEVADEFIATIMPGEQELIRADYCPSCWEKDIVKKASILASWHGKIPAPKEKKKTFINNELLITFFERLADEDEQVKINFRFVLTLILMRKRVLAYEKSIKCADGKEIWTLRTRGSDTRHKVCDPKMTQEEIDEVSEHLGEILEGQL